MEVLDFLYWQRLETTKFQILGTLILEKKPTVIRWILMTTAGNSQPSFTEVHRLHLWFSKVQVVSSLGREGMPHLAYQHHGHKKRKIFLHMTGQIFCPILGISWHWGVPVPSTTELDVSVRDGTVQLRDTVLWYCCRHNTMFYNSPRMLLLAAGKDRKLRHGNLTTRQIHNLVPHTIFFPF